MIDLYWYPIMQKKIMSIVQIIAIGERLIASINKNRLANDGVLRDNVDTYLRLKNVIKQAPPDNLKSQNQFVRELASAIREIEKQLDIVAPN